MPDDRNLVGSRLLMKLVTRVIDQDCMFAHIGLHMQTHAGERERLCSFDGYLDVSISSLLGRTSDFFAHAANFRPNITGLQVLVGTGHKI
jgi:hypothetical protein